MSEAKAAPKSSPWPTDLAFDRGAHMLDIGFEDGARFAIPFELLRIASPSAEVRGHRPGEAKLVAGKAAVGVARAEPVGRYAVRIVFDDGHDTGLYAWELLYALGRDRDAKMAEYAEALRKAGLNR